MSEWKTLRLPIGDDGPEARMLYGQDVRASLQGMAPSSVHAVVTSPPYWGLRSYLASDDENKKHEIGSEPTLDGFVEHLVELFRDLKRVLRKDGSVWLNLGDSYAGGGRAGKNPEYQRRHTSFGKLDYVSSVGGMGHPMPVPDGLKAKDMVGVPWRVAFALQKDGWYLRAACPWIKRNVMPESCTDRPSSAVEYIFLLAHPDSGGQYFYDIHGSRAPLAGGSHLRLNQSSFATQKGGAKDYGNEGGANANRSARRGVENLKAKVEAGDATRQKRATDWFFQSLEDILNGDQVLLLDENDDPLSFVVNPKPYPGAHFAVFPPKLVEPCVLLSTSAHGVCSKCGSQWARVVSRQDAEGTGAKTGGDPDRNDGGTRVRDPSGNGGNVLATRRFSTGEWEPTCECEGADVVRPVVLDVFSGSATTGMVSLGLGRNYVGLDLNAEYFPLAEARVLQMAAPDVGDAPESAGSVLDLFGED